MYSKLWIIGLIGVMAIYLACSRVEVKASHSEKTVKSLEYK